MAVPGAFTPTCHAKHLPSYVEHFDALKAKDVDTVACVSVNDAFVLDVWAKQGGADGKVLMLADTIRNNFDMAVMDLPRHFIMREPALFSRFDDIVIVGELTLQSLRDVNRLMSEAGIRPTVTQVRSGEEQLTAITGAKRPPTTTKASTGNAPFRGMGTRPGRPAKESRKAAEARETAEARAAARVRKGR